MRTSFDGTVTFASPSLHRLLGFEVADIVGTACNELFLDAAQPGVAARSEALRAGEAVAASDARLRTASGDVRWMRTSAVPLFDAAGAVVGCEVRARDQHTEVIARRAAATISAGNALLARATTEQEVLDGMCEAAVREGGYVFAWYGRPVLDERQSVAVIARTEAHASYLDTVEISWGDNPLGRGPTGVSIRTEKTCVLNDSLATLAYAPWAQEAGRHGFLSAISLPVFVDGGIDGAFVVYAGETHAFTDATTAVLEDLATQIGLGLERIRSVERIASVSAERALLATAIDQAAESVVITTVDGRVEYANPAALRASGRTSDEVIGHRSTVFDEVDDTEVNAEMRATIARGAPWTGTLRHRIPDGTEAEVDLSVSPVHDDHGNHIAFIALGRDVTMERRLEADLSKAHSDRAEIATVVERMRPAASLVDAVDGFTAAVTQLEWVDRSVVLLERANGSLTRVASAGAAVAPVGAVAAASLDEVISIVSAPDGPIIFDLDDLEASDPLRRIEPTLPDALRATGFHAAAYVPIHLGDRTLGILSIGSRAADGVHALSAKRTILTDLGAYAGTVLTTAADQQRQVDALEVTIRTTIDEGRFHPVFQPVVDLRTREVVGHEALTRFDDGTRPDLRFAEAHACGLGLELEAACVARALAAATALPPDHFLGVNFAPSTVLSGHAARVLAGQERQIVLEVTEHARIHSYPALIAALAECHGALVSVDDAGAGYASLQHILELQPDVVKLDIGLVHGIDADPARQALVAGLHHFAELTGTELLAEGIETEAEAAVLRELRVQYGQGYLFGRPEPIS